MDMIARMRHGHLEIISRVSSNTISDSDSTGDSSDSTDSSDDSSDDSSLDHELCNDPHAWHCESPAANLEGRP